jgi:class 3 adenylate cyclase
MDFIHSMQAPAPNIDALSPADLAALVRSANALSAEVDLTALLQTILDTAGQLTNSPAGSVLLHDAERGGLYFAAATGEAAPTVLGRFGEGKELVPLDNSMAGEVFRTGRSVVDHRIASDPRHFKGVDERTKNTTYSMVCVPLMVGADRLGVVQIINKRTGDYHERDLVILEQFASHAAVAIRNAQLVRRLLAHMGLYTSRALGRRTEDLLLELAKPARLERMTVMFADLRGSTRLAQTLGPPQPVQQILNEFLSTIATAVVRYDGIVNKLLGDGALGLFRDHDTARRALRCAFDILERFETLRADWDAHHDQDLTFLDVGIGIVTDDVIIGTLGTNEVRDFTVLGAAVNFAAALEQAARGNRRVLIDQNTYRAAEQIIAEVDDRESFELHRPDQPPGHRYKRYHVKRLRKDVGLGPAAATAYCAPDEFDVSGYYRESWAVVVGVDRYAAAAIPVLSYAVADARAVAETLPRFGFAPNRTIVLEDESATREAIHRAVHGHAHAMHRDDRLFVFFALHGDVRAQWKGEEAYLLPYDADPSNLALTAIPMGELAQIGRRSPAKHVLFALDACFSGYAARRDPPSAPAVPDLALLTRERVVQILTAGTSGQRVVEDGGHGLFTKHLLKGIEGWADPDRTGLTALRLATYVQERVMAESNGLQTPQYGKLDGEGEFLFRPPRR